MADKEFEDLLATTLSCPSDITPPPGFTSSVWNCIDAWEQDRKREPASILSRVLNARMRNGERVLVLIGTMLFGTVFIGLFLWGSYVIVRHSSLVLRFVQIFLGPNIQELHSVALLGGLTAVGGLVLASLALSERLFGSGTGEMIA